MKELDMKGRAFALYAAKVLKCKDGAELDKKIRGMSKEDLDGLAKSFNEIYDIAAFRKGGRCPEGTRELSGGGCVRCRGKRPLLPKARMVKP